MAILHEVRIQNYRSFTEETVRFSDATCFVGPNEGGKTNLLEAIYHLSANKQTSSFTPDELRIGAPGYPNGQIAIEYIVELTNLLAKDILQSFPQLEGRHLFLTKTGMPKKTPFWSSASNIPKSAIPGIIQINNKRAFVQSFGSDTEEKQVAKKRSRVGWFVNDASVDLRRKPYRRLLEEEKITLLDGAQKVDFVNDLLTDTVLENVRLYLWKYKEEDFLQETIPIASLVQNPNKYRTVTNMFIVSGWEKDEFSSKLQGQTPMVYASLLGDVERSVNSLIRNNWSSRRNLEVKLSHTGERLTIHLEEPGSRTPPEYRSDGLKWFLTFLINFRAQSETIRNYILLIDEPGLYLHPRGQKDVLEELDNLSHNNQVIYTTHQTFLINKNRPERVRVIHRKIDRKGTLSPSPFYASKVSGIADPKSILTDKLLRTALGFGVSDISPINEKNILVEGVFDREVFHTANRHWQVLDLNETSVIACGGAAELSKHANLYRSNGLKVVCFYDSDAPGRSACRANDKVPQAQRRQVRNFERRKEFETLEDLIPDEIFNQAYEQWTRKWHTATRADAIERPRMKSLERHFLKDRKIVMKHSLEEILVEGIRAGIRKDDSEFGILRRILEGLKSKLE